MNLVSSIPWFTVRYLRKVTDWLIQGNGVLHGQNQPIEWEGASSIFPISISQNFISFFVKCGIWLTPDVLFPSSKTLNSSLRKLNQMLFSIQSQFLHSLLWGNRTYILKSQYKSDFKKKSLCMYFIDSILHNRTNILPTYELLKLLMCKRKAKGQIIWFFLMQQRIKVILPLLLWLLLTICYIRKKWVRFKYSLLIKISETITQSLYVFSLKGWIF